MTPVMDDMMHSCGENADAAVNSLSSLMAASFSLGQMVGPIVGAGLTTRIGFPWACTLMALVLLLLVQSALIVAVEGRRQHRLHVGVHAGLLRRARARHVERGRAALSGGGHDAPAGVICSLRARDPSPADPDAHPLTQVDALEAYVGKSRGEALIGDQARRDISDRLLGDRPGVGLPAHAEVDEAGAAHAVVAAQLEAVVRDADAELGQRRVLERVQRAVYQCRGRE